MYRGTIVISYGMMGFLTGKRVLKLKIKEG